MATYNIDISASKGFKQLNDIIYEIESLFKNSYEFKEYIVSKAQRELEDICTQKLHNLESFGLEAHYMAGMYVTIEEDIIILGNNSMVDIEGKNMSETTKLRYSNGLSLAKIVEYGVGSKGTSVEDWETNVNQQEHIQKYGRDGWYYVDDNGSLHWTYGIEGKFIFYELANRIRDNIASWINEYINIRLSKID